MRVVIAPDSFGGTLDAAAAAAAIADGWRRGAPGDTLVLLPAADSASDGGPDSGTGSDPADGGPDSAETGPAGSAHDGPGPASGTAHPGPPGLDAALEGAGLAVTGEGSFDWRSLRGTLVTAVARSAAARGVPCLVLAGQVSVGRREAAAVGVDDAYAVAGGSEAGVIETQPAALAALAEKVAWRWSR